jgi:hypothetical protein
MNAYSAFALRYTLLQITEQDLSDLKWHHIVMATYMDVWPTDNLLFMEAVAAANTDDHSTGDHSEDTKQVLLLFETVAYTVFLNICV